MSTPVFGASPYKSQQTFKSTFKSEETQIDISIIPTENYLISSNNYLLANSKRIKLKLQ